MTELSLNPNNASLPGSAFESSPSKWKRPLLASVQSFFFAGLGQLYNRQLRKAIVFATIGPAVDVIGGKAGAFHTLFGLAAMVIFSVSWKIFVVTDAFLIARKHLLTGSPPPLPRAKTIPVFVLILLSLFLYGFCKDFLLDHIARTRAYRVPSVSNCPTVCGGERMIVDPGAYTTKPPQRGDLAMFKHPLFDSLLFKRVVGLPGDVITQSDDGIRVNGQPAALVDLTHVCGSPPDRDRSYLPIATKSVKVPTNSLYVIGDNWSESMDSRFEEFGFVPIKNVRGRPLFLYWSPYKNRIGCRLR